ncbi:MAG: ATP-binding cassette domain-containing protein [Oscillospiraceae bacterium]
MLLKFVILQKPKVKDVSFGISRGEIVGLAGLLGSGRTEVAEMLFGSEMPDAGEILYEGIFAEKHLANKGRPCGTCVLHRKPAFGRYCSQYGV